MSRPYQSLSALRQRLARLDPVPRIKPGGLFTLGAERIDARLGGGLARAGLHEFFAGEEDAVVAAAFVLIMALRGGDPHKPILWVRDERAEQTSGQIYGPGLIALGADPDRFIFIHAPDELAVLRAGAECVKCAGTGAVVIEPYRKARSLDLTATRRLAMAAASSGVLSLLLRVGADPAPSAAQTRWQVAAVPSLALASDAPGHPAFALSLLRHRAGISAFTATLEWDRDQQICVEQSRDIQAITRPLLSGGVSAAAVLRSDQAQAA
jgi:protein ImuA